VSALAASLAHFQRSLRIALLACLAAAAPLSAAPLDPNGDPDQFRREIEEINRKPPPGGEPLAQSIGSVILADAKARSRCLPKKLTLGALEPITLDGMIAGLIARGGIENAWIMSVKLDDCPPADPIRVIVFRAADGQRLQAIFAGQGESLTWPTLARDALRATVGKVVERLRGEAPACTPPNLTQTSIQITERSPDLGPSVYGIRLKGSWTEIWGFDPCGHHVAVPIRFTTNGTGGAYWDIDPSKIVFHKKL
jgi:hypothetical protein